VVLKWFRTCSNHDTEFYKTDLKCDQNELETSSDDEVPETPSRPSSAGSRGTRSGGVSKASKTGSKRVQNTEVEKVIVPHYKTGKKKGDVSCLKPILNKF
jgi:hypothetical protein